MMNDPAVHDPRARLGEYLVPRDARVVNCTSCGAQICFTETGTGARMPLALSTIRVDADGRRWALNHWANCPGASKHRRPTELARLAAKPSGKPIDLRDVSDYLERHHLVVVSSTISDDGKGKLLVELQTRHA